MPFIVEVFPVAPERWIAVIDSFSTEVASAAAVEEDVRESIRAVLKIPDPQFTLVDDLGQSWTPRAAPAQLDRLGFTRQPFWHATAAAGRRRLFDRSTPRFGDCPACGHDGREHILAEGECSECVFEIEHEDPSAPTEACRLMPTATTRDE
ncbi:hypothetical protein [Xylanimonas sp. McL0601]|uniref:hypothetical protein n=1 Tax=Xylanimonas sp. McL0601 TaxID=3414739 RepID=UPI003CF4D7CB